MSGGTVVFSFAAFKAAIARLPQVRTPAIAGATTGVHAVPSALAGGRANAALAGLTAPDMNAAACAGLVNLAEIAAAAPYILPGTDHHSWRDNWLFPIASAISLAPHLEPELRRIFDEVNRRTADPTKATKAEYFQAANLELTNAIKATNTKLGSGETISFTRIFQFALEGGWDGLTKARRKAGTTPNATTVVSRNTGLFASSGAFFAPVKSHAKDLHPVKWLVNGLLMRGEITILSGQGGGAKTATAIHVAVALASGRQHAGPFPVTASTGGLRVGIISAEEDTNRIGLLTAAACSVLRLTRAERSAVDQNLIVHDASASSWRLGEPAPGSRQDISPEDEDRGLQALTLALGQSKPDLVIMDTLAALFAAPSEIDNNIMTALMRRLTRAARAADCAILLLHHTPKMSREDAAKQRGEATLVRGGGAIVNSSRIALTITSLPHRERETYVTLGQQPDNIRRLEHAKINDAPPMAPAYFAITAEQIRVADSTDHAVRAVQFIPPPPSSSAGGSITDAMRTVVMRAIDAGVYNKHGDQVPLSPGGGRINDREALPAIATALINADPNIPAARASGLAKEVLQDLMNHSCVVVEDVRIPQRKNDGKGSGTKPVRGLVTRWSGATWAVQVPQTVAAAPDPAPSPDPEPAP